MTASPLVLVADDDADVLELVSLRLARDGFEVVQAHDGLTALQIAQHRVPVLAVLDVAMPGLDGDEVVRLLRSNDRTRRMQLILLTARAQEADVARGLAAGADAYVKKPFSPRELSARVRELVGDPYAAGGR